MALFRQVKNTLKYILQQLLGFRTYLFVFALFKIRTLRFDRKERDFFQFLSLLTNGKGDVLDIGANLGIMTFHLANQLPNVTVHAVEPIPVNLQVLEQLVKKYRLANVKVYPHALGDTVGQLEMILPHDGKTKMQGLSHVKHESITDWNEGDSYSVEVKRLDEMSFSKPIQGIKIDVENFEYFVLIGGKILLETNRPIIYAELWENENRKRCEDLLLGLGYTQHIVKNGQVVPFTLGTGSYQNFIFIPSNSTGVFPLT